MAKKEGLNKYTTIHLNKWRGYSALFKKSNSAVNLRSVFKAQVVLFNSNLEKISKVASRATYDLSGINIEKEGIKKMAAAAFGGITKNVLSFALTKKLTELKSQMENSTTSKLFYEKDKNFVSRCNNLNAELLEILEEYDDAENYFTEEELEAAMELVKEFESRLGKWAVKNADIRAAKKELVDVWIPKMNTLLGVMEGLLPGAIKNSYPRFEGVFMKMKKTVNTGKRTQGVMAVMKDAETGALFINNGRMETVNYKYGEQKVMRTNSLGKFKAMRLKIGVWEIKFSAEGYETQVIEVAVEARRTTKIMVKMEGSALPLSEGEG